MPTTELTHPALFLGHGNPMHALGHDPVTDQWCTLGSQLPRPQGIVVFSAHWGLKHCAVTAMARPRTIHDFGGFPRALYQIQYPCPGSPQLAHRVCTLLSPWPVHTDHEWGLDHGAWSLLLHLYPDADIPVIQVALDLSQSPGFHYELGKRLAPLRKEGVLLLGSGNIVHHLGAALWEEMSPPHAWAKSFDDWVVECIRKHDHESLLEWDRWPAEGYLAVPTPEHFLPLLPILGSFQSTDQVSFPVRLMEMAAISMTGVLLSPREGSSGPETNQERNVVPHC
ncbi:4,5-DOPA dioxygenase extradiol [Ferrovum myxofaciens]|jgi:4,5-DOPA dioxygenase extradiol|uniref:4,5-DOPA dioxygenase extradiol n=1 Tax=Ferrovum myxofaciens TaxID=416213 RepID=A0A8F3IJN4_9PROT|nr:4,5-DOPA dioxygenase extradiol [Ferrovum myxofaciens]NDU89475.1 4,5-DOPA dioxygenase extradiol [Ferrovum sp.]KXW57354.1 LigB family dioxygenase [Ferrovum myxofaciens]MBU6993771.1 4,5-DOPA dioxygenase extradiol [Ferrovum myxofaciens]QKE37833.1 MAG: 4,5-DOPA dioxygenase extradiol [Ferrovum myxofaciens]QKE40465.1 MAG: 4,5-DOPA dioxygenase extradiol [Ferrovum myxofaciens]